MNKNIIPLILCPLVLFCASCEKAQKMTSGAPTVEFQKLARESVGLKRDFPGRVVSSRMAEIRPQTGGILKERLFDEGDNVEAGQILYKIDDAPLKAEYKAAKARLAQATSREDASRRHMERCILLAKNNAVRLQERDDAIAAFREVKAEIDAAREQMARAEINLGYSSIRAPISGKIGRSFVREGALLAPDQSEPLAVIRQSDPIYVDFSLPAGEMLTLRQEIAKGSLDPTSRAGIELFLENGAPYASLSGAILKGEILLTETIADERTGAVTIRAKVANPDSLLLPGMYIRARMDQGVIEDAISIPQRSLARDSRNQPVVFILVPEKDDFFRLEERHVRLHGEHDGKWIVSEGIQDGELLLVEGLQKARNGLQVKGRPAKARNS